MEVMSDYNVCFINALGVEVRVVESFKTLYLEFKIKDVFMRVELPHGEVLMVAGDNDEIVDRVKPKVCHKCKRVYFGRMHPWHSHTKCWICGDCEVEEMKERAKKND